MLINKENLLRLKDLSLNKFDISDLITCHCTTIRWHQCWLSTLKQYLTFDKNKYSAFQFKRFHFLSIFWTNNLRSIQRLSWKCLSGNLIKAMAKRIRKKMRKQVIMKWIKCWIYSWIKINTAKHHATHSHYWMFSAITV